MSEPTALDRIIATEFHSGMSRHELAHKYHVTLDAVDSALRKFLKK